MKTVNTTKTIDELLKMMKNDELVRETMQRTPSHDEKKALEIIDSILSNRYCGIITLAELEKNGKKVYSILDGSSRLQDIENYFNNSIWFTITEIETIATENGTKTIKSKTNKNFNSLNEKEKNQFLSFAFPCIVLQNATDEERQSAFININSSVALSNIQKNKGLVSDKMQAIIDVLSNSKVINNCFTKRQIQKDEIVSFAFTMLSNIYDCYSSSNKTLTNNVKDIDLSEFDLNKLETISSLFDEIEIQVNKYVLISHFSNLYNSCIDLSKVAKFDNNIIYKVDTAGANSTPKNDERLSDSKKLLDKLLKVDIITGKEKRQKSEAISLDNLHDIAK